MALDAGLARCRGDAHDAPVAVHQHGFQQRTRHVVERVETGVDDLVPGRRLHPHEEFVVADAGVVHEDVDACMAFENVLNGVRNSGIVGDVEGR